METEKQNAMKKTGAIVAALLVILYFGSMLGVCLWAGTIDKPPVAILVIIFVSLGLPIAGVIVALFQRIKEINGGEEDEAGKY